MEGGRSVEHERARDVHVDAGHELAEHDLRRGRAAYEEGPLGLRDGQADALFLATPRNRRCGRAVERPVVDVEPVEAGLAGPLEAAAAGLRVEGEGEHERPRGDET